LKPCATPYHNHASSGGLPPRSAGASLKHPMAAFHQLRLDGLPPRSAGASLKPVEALTERERLAAGLPPRSAGASLKPCSSRRGLPRLPVFPRVLRGPH